MGIIRGKGQLCNAALFGCWLLWRLVGPTYACHSMASEITPLQLYRETIYIPLTLRTPKR